MDKTIEMSVAALAALLAGLWVLYPPVGLFIMMVVVAVAGVAATINIIRMCIHNDRVYTMHNRTRTHRKDV